MTVAEQRYEGERRAWSGARGSLTFIRLRDGVALIVLDGKLDDEAAAAWNLNFSWLTRGSKLSLFLDGAAVTFPNTSFISTGTTSITGIRTRLDRCMVLVAGGLIEMIAKTANLTLGGLMQITRDRGVFENNIERLLS